MVSSTIEPTTFIPRSNSKSQCSCFEEMNRWLDTNYPNIKDKWWDLIDSYFSGGIDIEQFLRSIDKMIEQGDNSHENY